LLHVLEAAAYSTLNLMFLTKLLTNVSHLDWLHVLEQFQFKIAKCSDI